MELRININVSSANKRNNKNNNKNLKTFKKSCQRRFIQCVGVAFLTSCIILQFYSVIFLYFGLRALLVICDVLLDEDEEKLEQLKRKVKI